MKRLSFLLLLAFVPSAMGQDAAIRFPSFVQPVAPVIPVNPAIPPKLTANVFYVVEADVPCIVTASPLGLVKIIEEAGPIRARGVFVDGNGQTETRLFKGKQVFFVEAMGAKGLCELLVIPIGAKDVADIHRKMIDVGGVGPRPPPEPDPKPEPKPDPSIPAPIPLAGFRVLFVEETGARGKLTTGQANTLFGKASRDWLDANTVKEDGNPGYRIYDKDVSAASDLKHWQDALARPRNSVPWVVISNGKSGFEGPLPATEAECRALLQKYLPTGR